MPDWIRSRRLVFAVENVWRQGSSFFVCAQLCHGLFSYPAWKWWPITATDSSSFHSFRPNVFQPIWLGIHGISSARSERSLEICECGLQASCQGDSFRLPIFSSDYWNTWTWGNSPSDQLPDQRCWACIKSVSDPQQCDSWSMSRLWMLHHWEVWFLRVWADFLNGCHSWISRASLWHVYQISQRRIGWNEDHAFAWVIY